MLPIAAAANWLRGFQIGKHQWDCRGKAEYGEKQRR